MPRFQVVGLEFMRVHMWTYRTRHCTYQREPLQEL